MEKLSIKQAVIVEGKYDKIRLEGLIDGVILPVNGFGIFKDKDMQRLIRGLAKTRGIVLLTDSDAAGFKIRAKLAGIVAEGEIINVYIPDIPGREKRKQRASAEGKLGVEGVGVDILREAFERAGVAALAHDPEDRDPITRLDLYEDGLLGGENAAEKRRKLYAALELPARLSASAALPLLNQRLTRQEYKALISKETL